MDESLTPWKGLEVDEILQLEFPSRKKLLVLLWLVEDVWTICSLSGFGSLLVLGAWVPQVRTLLWLPAFVPPSCAPVSESSCWILLDKQKNFKAISKEKMLSKNNMGRWGLYAFSLNNRQRRVHLSTLLSTIHISALNNNCCLFV